MKEDKIEVGEYVRTNEGIARVVEIKNEESDILNYYCLDNNMGTLYKGIVKHSKNIIDLIEEDDYVNGERVLGIGFENCDYDIATEYSDDFGEYFGINKEDIKSIVTKEQFKSIEYRLEE